MADLFSEKLIPNPKKTVSIDIPNEAKNLGIGHSIMSNLGLTTLIGQQETEAPIAFTYSLFYVFYDQYTYIRGVLA